MSSQPGPAFGYHRSVSYDRRRMEGYSLDWATQPRTGKDYPGLPRIPLPDRFGFPGVTLERALEGPAAGAPQRLTRERLARILFCAYGATARSRHPGGEFLYRSAPSAGALYPVEIYLALAEPQAGECGLEPGLYHYPSPEHGLTRLRSGGIGPGQSLFFLTAITFRSAWKYRARAFRYCGLDTGHAAENLVLALRAEGYDPAFAEDLPGPKADAFLGLDPAREWSLLALSLGGPEEKAGPALPEPTPEEREKLAPAGRVSDGEKTYPELEKIRALAGLPRTRAAENAEAPGLGLEPGEWAELPLPDETGSDPEDSLGKRLVLRRSKRNFVRTPFPAGEMARLARMMRLETDLPFRVGMLLGGVEGIADGFYLLDRAARRMAFVRSGDLCREMAEGCLDQAWLGQAAVHFLFLADLAGLDRSGGPRAYKEALILAGRLGQRAYLGAARSGLGCCGVGAFYDDECRELLGLSRDSRMLYLVAAGPIKR